MNPQTLEVYEVPAGEQPKAGSVALTAAEADEVRPLNRAQRREWLRTHRAGYGLPRVRRKRR